MNPIAEKLNRDIEKGNPVLLEMMSDIGLSLIHI